MKKSVFFVLTILLVFSLFFVSAENSTETTKSKAVSCLRTEINSKKCSSLSTEEKIFSLLSVGLCESELIDDSLSNKCWPDSDCSVKTTAQAILALKQAGTGTSKSENWLLNQVGNFSSLEWFLQVDSLEPSSCTIKYSNTEYPFSIGEDQSLNGNVGNCLSIYDDYWFEISPSCYDQEFEISCESSFITSTLYKPSNSETFYVSGTTNSASGSGSTREEVGASCFLEDGVCSYEGTLWATLLLKYTNSNYSSFLPYLISMADSNSRYLPEAFLYKLTGYYKNDLILQQEENKWWSKSGDKFYDTAVALLPFQGTEVIEKTNAEQWLKEVQDANGCWQGNIRNTGFLVYSLWSTSPSFIDDDTLKKDCEGSGFFCLSSSVCASSGGDILTNYSGCSGSTICCSNQTNLESCAVLLGELCSSSEECVGGEFVKSLDSPSAKLCCVGGTCEVPEPTPSECELIGGTCKSSCGSGEEISSYTCDSGVCCMKKEFGFLWLIILLFVLVMLTVLGIIFREKLKLFLLKLKTKLKFKPKLPKGKTPTTSVTQNKLSPTPSSKVYPGAVQRTIIPNQPVKQLVRKPIPNKSEFDDILKKLKEIGK